MTQTFEIGKTYATRSACDHNCIFEYTVIARTKSFITIKDKWGEESRVGCKPCKYRPEEGEVAYPEGRYSMCPVIRASSPQA